MSTLRTCPKCQRKSLGGGPTWGRVWCLYAAEGACGYSAPLDLDRDVDDKQMTHSDEPTTKKTIANLAGMVEETLYRPCEDRFCLAHPHVRDCPAANEVLVETRRTLDALIADVARLDRQLGDELAADSVLCPHAPNHILEAKCKELEAELACTTCRALHIQHGERLNA